jgi:hypothetical protein
VGRWTMKKPRCLPGLPVGIPAKPARKRAQCWLPPFFGESARSIQNIAAERIALVVRHELLQGNTELTQIIPALRLKSFCFRVRKGGEVQPSQKAKDSDDNQKLY